MFKAEELREEEKARVRRERKELRKRQEVVSRVFQCLLSTSCNLVLFPDWYLITYSTLDKSCTVSSKMLGQGKPQLALEQPF